MYQIPLWDYLDRVGRVVVCSTRVAADERTSSTTKPQTK